MSKANSKLLQVGKGPRILCPKCHTELQEAFCKHLALLTGIAYERLRNGSGIQELQLYVQIAQRVLKESEIEIEEDKVMGATLQKVEEVLRTRLSEEAKQSYEDKLDQYAGDLRKLKEDLGKAEEEKEDLQEELQELRIKGESIPYIKGKEQEIELVKQLESVRGYCQDEFLATESSPGEDITCRIYDGNQPIEDLIIESKNVKTWQRQYFAQFKEELRRKGLQHGFIVTTAMPRESLNQSIYVAKDGTWVVNRIVAGLAYRIYREFLVRMYRHKLSAEQAQKAIAQFKQLDEKVFSKMGAARESVERIRGTADRMQNHQETSCRTLRKEADSILGNMTELEEVFEKTLKDVTTE